MAGGSIMEGSQGMSEEGKLNNGKMM